MGICSKNDGRYRARTVAKAFSQIPRTDFQENHAPVVNDTTFHLMLVLKWLLKLCAGQFDFETAFLYGEFEEELWMELPEGYCEYVLELSGMEIRKTRRRILLSSFMWMMVGFLEQRKMSMN